MPDRADRTLKLIADLPDAIRAMLQTIDNAKDAPDCFEIARPAIERFCRLVRSITACERKEPTLYSLIGETIVVGFAQGFALNTHEAISKFSKGLLASVKQAWHSSYAKPEYIPVYASCFKLLCEEICVTEPVMIEALKNEAAYVQLGSTAQPRSNRTGKRQSTANERLHALMSLSGREPLGWKARDIAFIIDCSPSSLSETRMWQELEKLREDAKHRRRIN